VSDAPVSEGSTSDATGDGGSGDATVTDGAGSDGATSDGATSDGTTSDGGGTDGESDGGPDGGASAQLVIPGANLVLSGVTTDDHVVYYDGTTQTYFAQPLGGGAATTIYAAPASAYAGYGVVSGNVAFGWSWNSAYIGTLVAWSPGMSQGATLTTTGLAYIYDTEWASDDGKHVAYVENTSSDATVGSIYGANIDGSGATLLVSNVDIASSYQGNLPACFPRLVFRGDYAVLSYCTAEDAGLAPVLQSFSVANGWAPAADIPSWVHSRQYYPADWAQFTYPFAVDPDGTQIAGATTASGNGALQIFPIDGGPGTVVDPSVQLAPTLSFAGSTQDPWAVLYNNDAGALMRANASSPTPQTLVDAGVNYFNGLSTDGKWLLASSGLNPLGWFSDLSLVSTQTPGAPALVASSAQYDASPVSSTNIFRPSGPRGFTSDSSYALAMTNLQRDRENGWVGELTAVPVAPPYTPTHLGKGVVLAYLPAHGSKVVVADNFVDSDGGSVPTADIDEVDPASGGASVNIVQGVNGNALVTHDLSRVVYVMSGGAAPGIYASRLP